MIVIILLGLYTYAAWFGIAVVNCVTHPGCDTLMRDSFTVGMAGTLSLIGGLVSALVIAELAITTPGKPLLARAHQGSSALSSWVLRGLTSLYLLVWAFTGVAAFVVGTMKHPGVLQPLTDLGQAWLGLAVAAGYAYFGIKPPE
jgi:hypothetical protein